MRPEHWLFPIPLRLRSLFRRAETDQELDDELSDHLERKTEEYVAQGMTREEAWRRARLDLGGIEETKEKCRDARCVTWLQDIAQDLRYGPRMLRKSASFTIIALLTLTLGLGINCAIFTVVSTVLLRPLRYPDSERLALVQRDFPEITFSSASATNLALVNQGMPLVWVVRTTGDPRLLVRAVQQQLLRVATQEAPDNFRTMEDVLSASIAQQRFNMLLLGLFGGLAVALGAIGLYGVLSYLVMQRTHEIGIRMALGANRSEILRLVVTNGLRMTLTGLGLGIVAAAGLARVLLGLLYGVKPTDPSRSEPWCFCFAVLRCWHATRPRGAPCASIPWSL